MSRTQSKRYNFGSKETAQTRFLTLEAVNTENLIYFPLFHLTSPYWKAKQLPRNIPPMNFTARLAKSKRKALA